MKCEAPFRLAGSQRPPTPTHMPRLTPGHVRHFGGGHGQSVVQTSNPIH